SCGSVRRRGGAAAAPGREIVGGARVPPVHGPPVGRPRPPPRRASRERDRDRRALPDPVASATVLRLDGAARGELPGGRARRARGVVAAALPGDDRRPGREGVRGAARRAGPRMKKRTARRRVTATGARAPAAARPAGPGRPLRLLLVAGARPNFMKV